MEMLKIDSLSFTYAGEKEPALREVSFNLEAGEFALITGETGCGKSTLLRLLKRELAPRGRREGRILIGGRDAEELTARESGKKIGYVAQRPEEQTVTDRVWHELAFGLENLGIPEAEMRRRVAETAQFFGLEDCFDASPEELSGGKRQLLNLAAATVMMPELLLLDEPTAKLDPIAAKQFLAALERLNRETGMTILMAEHRLEDSLSRAGKLIVMAQG
ncbi:MAG: ABC transporter ATP-binding protein, partial [Clostridia bacterium]|nr:ABC transporter ATP-binding protein [Clostridia bacterium]